jgi:uncharacterized protein (DUF1015 family)
MTTPKNYPSIALQIPELYLPRPGVDLTRWSVVACDQYTSQPEYWQQVQDFVGSAPSTLNLILPEIWLGKPEEAAHSLNIHATMRAYLDNNLLEPLNGMIYIERSVDHKIRRGLMACLDLEAYDYNKGSSSLIRATEGTIIERLPPRMKIRQGAMLELPHILVLIDDPEHTVIEAVAARKDHLEKCYDFDLMMEGGHLSGYAIRDPQIETQIVQALQNLADPDKYHRKYDVAPSSPVLLYAIGDGNHSLATAKACWEKLKVEQGAALSPNHPARYALVEIENVHDSGLEFEPIHRVLFGVQKDILQSLRAGGAYYTYTPCQSVIEMSEWVNRERGTQNCIGLMIAGQCGVLEISKPNANLAVGRLQGVLDLAMKDGLAERIDYIHGLEVFTRLSEQPQNAGFYLPPMDKSALFRTVILEGALPRKTFSMGEAHEKRFYMESRRIV